jgi:PIN domain nuclease of toxin-antitoxin system
VKFLLDTHIWIWAINQPAKLNRPVLRQLQNPKNELFLSPVSVWEAQLLAKRGKLRLKKSWLEWVEAAFTQIPVREAPFNFMAAAQTAKIQLPQADVGDVFLAATASAFDLTLVTSDSQLLGCSWLKTLAND